MTEPTAMWRPISVQDTTEFVPPNQTIRAKRINFQLADGTTSYVTVPLDQFTSEIVANEIHKAAEAHYAVMGQEGPPITYQPVITRMG